MGNFEVVAAATDQRLDLATYREVGTIVGSYLTEPVSPVNKVMSPMS